MKAKKLIADFSTPYFPLPTPYSLFPDFCLLPSLIISSTLLDNLLDTNATGVQRLGLDRCG